MTRILTGYLTALLMVLPMCWCCAAQALPVSAVAEEICPACKSSAPEHEAPASHDPASDCACCAGTLERGPAPEALSAPRSTLEPLTSAAAWPSSDAPALRADHTSSFRSLPAALKAPPRWRHALWLRHQALLL